MKLNKLERFLYKMSEIFTNQTLFDVKDQYGYRFVIFGKKKFNDQMYHISIKERGEILGFKTWIFKKKLTFLIDSSSYESLIKRMNLEDRFFYTEGVDSINFIMEKTDFRKSIEYCVKYLLSLKLGNERDSLLSKELSDQINSEYKVFTRESRLSSILDK